MWFKNVVNSLFKMCLITKSNTNLEYSHGDYNFKNISISRRQGYSEWGYYLIYLAKIDFIDGLR